MRYEELITELCEVIKETENDAEGIFDNTDEISKIIDNIKIPIHKREKLKDYYQIFTVFYKDKICIDKK